MSKHKIPLIVVGIVTIILSGGIYLTSYAMVGPRTTGVVIQNLGSKPANVKLEYYNLSGELVVYTTTTVQPVSALGFGAGSQQGLGNMFVGSLVVMADQDVAAIGNDTDSDSMGMYSAVSEGATTVYLPAVYHGFGNWESEIWIQTTETVPSGAQATVQFIDRLGQQTGSIKSIPLKSCATVMVSPAHYEAGNPDIPGGDIPYGWAGGTVIQSAYKMAVIVKNVRPTSEGSIAEMYNGFAQGDTTVYIPAMYKYFGPWDSNGINVQNIGDAPTYVMIDFYDRLGTLVHTYPFTRSFAANGGAQAINTKNILELAEGYAGTAVVRSLSGQPVIAVADVTDTDTGKGNAYNAVLASDGASVVYLPSQYKRFGGWRSGVIAMNVGTAPTTITFEYYARGASTMSAITTSAEISPNIAFAKNTLTPDIAAQLPDEWTGTVIVRSGGQPLVVVGNVDGGYDTLTPPRNQGKAAMYIAFPQKY
ncbi:MAG TPA: hypothetical protein PLH19_14375 [Anaerolineae bacterium]|nr:hypothetical protein [Anaerolineae bacterium]HQH39703.1 hypothetical protein [Anaerolineae bacterium]